MEVELAVLGGSVITPDGLERVGIAIDKGRIVAVAPDAALPPSRERIDATGLHVIPGVIDTHTHARDPGVDEREDFGSATAAAAAGGITTILEMPISRPSVYSADVLRARVAAVQPKAYVDFGMYGGAAGDNLDQIQGLADAGVVGFKTFRTPAPVGRESEFIGLCAPDAVDYSRALERVAATGLVAAVHAEDAAMLERNKAALQAVGDHGPLSHARWRPPEVETSSVIESIALARRAHARLELAHCSTADVVALAVAARADGVAVTVETCPHYLFLTEDDIARFGPYAKINPPLRSAEHTERLWAHVACGDVDVIGSDHSPFLVREKEPFWNNMWEALPGAPGLEALLPLMLTAVADRRLTIERMVALTSGNAARIFGLREKGSIRVGADADLAIVDTNRVGVIDTKRWLTRSRGTAKIWHGKLVRGAVVATLVRGSSVYRDGILTGKPGWGRLVRPHA